jgi:hypothetical protein
MMVGGAEILDEVALFLKRFISYPSDDACVAHTLWIAHTHLMDCWESTPRLAFLSAERMSGKTRALEISELLVANPVMAVNVSPAYLVRKVAECQPTILYDEVDNLFAKKAAPETNDVRALLNGGHRRGAYVGRCVTVGRRVETEELSSFGAVALAGIGSLPDTVGSRTIIIDMRRRAYDEQVTPYRRRDHAKQGEAVRKRLETWCQHIVKFIDLAKVAMPAGIEDRDADCWECLLAIAEEAQGDWPARAERAAESLLQSAREHTETDGVLLLKHLKDIFGDADKLATEIVLARLHDLPESPWKDIKGRPLEETGLATRLRPFGVRPTKIRVGEDTRRGYRADHLYDAWKRYVPPLPGLAEHLEQTERNGSWGGTPGTPRNTKMAENS